MKQLSIEQTTSRWFLQLGILLFFLGLATGFSLPLMENSRMGLSSHLQGVLNGMFLMALGLLWQRLQLPVTAQRAVFGLAVFGTFANWLATLLAGLWGAGVMMPIAGLGGQGSPLQESIITMLLYSLSAAMLVVCPIVFWGLRRRRSATQADRSPVDAAAV